jgi:hypothetical protein
MLGLVLSLAPSVAKAGVVYGNLGANGNSPTVAGFSTVNLSTASRYGAFGFNTGAATFGSLELKSVTFALNQSVAAGSVEIWSSTGVGAAATPGSILSVGAVASTVAAPNGNLYTFTFNGIGPNFGSEGGYKLSQSTNYWVVLKGAAGLNWEEQANSASPTNNLNGSTYTAIDASNYVRASGNSGSNWTTAGVPQTAGFSINAVPEPSTYAMASIGAGIAGLAQLRRRRVR